MRPVLVLLLGLVGVACARPSGRELGDGRGRLEAATDELTLDARALDSLDALEPPDVTNKPFVGLVDAQAPLLLLEDAPNHFTVFDGVNRQTYDKGLALEPDAGQPVRFERLDERQVVARSEAIRRDPMKVLFFAAMLQRRGAGRAAQQLLRLVAKGSGEARTLVREVLAAQLVNDAAARYAAGAPRDDYERRLTRATALDGTNAARVARRLLTALRAPREAPPAPRSPLNTLIERRIEALAEERCPRASRSDHVSPAVARLLALGVSADSALHRVKDDGHPSRCLGDGGGGGASICDIDPSACPTSGPPIISLLTVGELARSVIARRQTPQNGAFEVECERHLGHDEEAEGLVSSALAQGDVEGAIAIVKSALGRLRIHMMERISRSVEPRVTSFLLDEATSGPVLEVRVRAGEALRARGDARWARLAAIAIDAARRLQDPEEDRCGRDVVVECWRAVLDADPAAALEPVAAGFATYGPRAKLDVVLDVARAVLVEKRPAPALPPKPLRSADATTILALALEDTRPVHLEMSFTVGPPRLVRPRVFAGRSVLCREPSPSDIAAVFLGERMNVAYACTDSPADKAAAVKRLLAMRGKRAGW